MVWKGVGALDEEKEGTEGGEKEAAVSLPAEAEKNAKEPTQQHAGVDVLALA